MFNFESCRKMNILNQAEFYNLIIRKSDMGVLLSSELSIEQFKTRLSRETLNLLLRPFQHHLDLYKTLSIEQISQISKIIVNSQHFNDGNHRTALLLCYHLFLFCNNQLLRISPYLLYASIDFEYFKNLHHLDSTLEFFSNNAVEAAILSRAIATVNNDELKTSHMEKILHATLKMPGLLNQLAKGIRLPHSPSCTQQDKLFRTFNSKV